MSSLKRSSTSLPPTGLSVEKKAKVELPISKGTSNFESALISVNFAISSHLGVITKSQEVLLNKIELIALRMETLEKEVNFLVEERKKDEIEKKLQQDSVTQWVEELKQSENLLKNSLEPGMDLDLTCSEMLNW